MFCHMPLKQTATTSTVDSAMMEGVKKLFSIGKRKPKEQSDPYFIFSFAGQSIESKVLYETYSPEFNQELKLGFKVYIFMLSLLSYVIIRIVLNLVFPLRSSDILLYIHIDLREGCVEVEALPLY